MKDEYGLNREQLGIDGLAVPTALRTIITWPATVLSEKCNDVTTFDHEYLYEFISNLVYTMLQNNGLGLAAPQIGLAKNIIVINKQWAGGYIPMLLINPEIADVTAKAAFTMNEGCLSVPGYFEDRSRYSGVIIKYQDAAGKHHLEEFYNQNAFVVQHEIDHLRGKVFTDDLSELKKGRIMKKIIKMKLGRRKHART